MPRRTAAQTAQSRQRILHSAARLMRERGFDGVGIDAIVADAGLTPGAFYTHFESKHALFAAVVEAALAQAEEHLPPIETQADIARFAQFYLGDRALRELGSGCIVAAMSADLSRQGGAVREAASAYIGLIHGRITRALAPQPRREASEEAWRLVAQLIGGVVLSRIVPASAPRQALLKAARRPGAPAGRG